MPLSPVRGPFDGDVDPEYEQYELALFRTLFGAETLHREFQMVQVSVTTPEEAVYVVNTNEGNPAAPPAYVVVSVRAKRNVMDAMRDSPPPTAVPIATARAPIDKSAFVELSALWSEVALGARHATHVEGYSGATYYFSGRVPLGIGAAMTIQPKPNTCAQGLIDVGRTLASFARSASARQRQDIRRELLRQVRALRERLKARAERLGSTRAELPLPSRALGLG
jgi:hypothetical protein